MPKLEDYTAKAALQGTGDYSNVYAYPQHTAQGLQDLSKGLNTAAGNLQSVANVDLRNLQQQKENEASIWAVNSMSALRTTSLANMEKAKSAAIPGAAGFASTQNNEYETMLTELSSAAPNGLAKQQFEMHARQYQSQHMGAAITYEASEKQRYAVQQHVDAAKSESQDLLLRPDMYHGIVVPRLAAIQLSNVDPDTKNRLREEVSSHFSETVIRGVGNKSPSRALQMLDSGAFSKLPGFNLYGDRLDRLRTHLESESNRVQSENRTQLRGAIEDHVADYQNGLVKDPVPPGYTLPSIRAILTPPDFARYQKQIEILSANKELGKLVRHGDLGTLADGYGAKSTGKGPSEDMGPAEMRKLLDTFGGDYSKALAARNWSPEKVTKAVKDFGPNWMSAVPSSTQEYVKRILTDARGVTGGKILQNAQGLIKDEAKMRQDDPAAVADRNAQELDPDNYSNKSLPERLAIREGIQKGQFKLPEFNQRLLTKAEATAFVAKIKGSSNLDDAQKFIRQLKGELMGATPTPKGKQIYSRVMGELISAGLDKGYMFMDFTSKQAYGNVFAQALKSKSDADVTDGIPPERIRGVRNALNSNQEYQNFLSVITLSGGVAGGEYAGSFAKTMERAALLASRDPKSSSQDLVKAMVTDLISEQMHIQGTYYIPTRDPYTNQGYDARKVDRVLSKAAEAWTTPTGQFIPDATSDNPHLSSSYTQDSIKDAKNLVWLTNEDGSGVYRAVKARGHPSLFTPITDKQGNRFEIKFTDTDFLEGKLLIDKTAAEMKAGK